MKLMFIAHSLLIDCGKASKQTRGQISQPLTEGGTAPWNKYNQ